MLVKNPYHPLPTFFGETSPSLQVGFFPWEPSTKSDHGFAYFFHTSLWTWEKNMAFLMCFGAENGGGGLPWESSSEKRMMVCPPVPPRRVLPWPVLRPHEQCFKVIFLLLAHIYQRKTIRILTPFPGLPVCIMLLLRSTFFPHKSNIDGAEACPSRTPIKGIWGPHLRQRISWWSTLWFCRTWTTSWNRGRWRGVDLLLSSSLLFLI